MQEQQEQANPSVDYNHLPMNTVLFHEEDSRYYKVVEELSTLPPFPGSRGVHGFTFQSCSPSGEVNDEYQRFFSKLHVSGAVTLGMIKIIG